MSKSILRSFLILVVIAALCACSSWQPTKNVWKTTRGFWNDYVSPPASVNYEDKGSLPEEAIALSKAVLGIDSQLKNLERTMQNADRPPTRDWLSGLFADYPWLSGFAGVKYDGTILGQEPADSIKQLDFIPLLYEDKKQNSRALRCDVQPSPMGPEIMLAAPLYDGTDFLGIVVAYFDMRSLMHFSTNPNDIVILTPQALLWPGKYEYGATPLAGVDWAKVARESTAGTCKNSNGAFFYVVHFLGNMPIVYAMPESGTFPEGNGGLEQGAAYFPQDREKLPPPPVPEGKDMKDKEIPAFEAPAEPEPDPAPPASPQPAARPQPMPEASDRNVIQQGSRESMLLKRGKPKATRQVQERDLEGTNVAPSRSVRPAEPPLELIPDQEGPTLPGGRPSPFGPGQETAPAPQRPSPFGPREEPRAAPQRPSPFGPREEAPSVEQVTPPAENAAPAQSAAPAKTAEEPAQAETPAAETPTAAPEEPHKPASLPGGRPSPFGPGR